MASRVVMPKLSDTMEEGLLIRWYKQEGDKVESGDPLAEIETDKAIMDLEAYGSGTLLKILASAETKVPAGGLIAVIGRPDEDISGILKGASATHEAKPTARSTSAPVPPPAKTSAPGATAGRRSITPRAQHLAIDAGLDLSGLTGTGPGGLITERDVRSSLEDVSPALADHEVETPSPMRATIAKRMLQSKQSAPHFYVTMEIAMDLAIATKEQLAQKGTKVTVTDILTRAVAITLRDFPQINTAYVGQRIRKYRNVHIGIAVGLEEGIITPVIRDADTKSLQQIASESRELMARAKSRKLAPEDYTGSTFSLSNLGMLEVDHFIAIIQPGEGAVLAVGAVREIPVVTDGIVTTGKRIKVTISCDHRVIDGLQAAQFLQAFKHRIERGEIE